MFACLKAFLSWLQEQRRFLRLYPIREVTVVEIAHRELVTAHSLQRFGKELFELADGEHPRVLLDFSNVIQCCPSVVGKLLVLDAKFSEVGSRLVLCNLSAEVIDSLMFRSFRRHFVVRNWNKEDDPLARLDGAWERRCHARRDQTGAT